MYATSSRHSFVAFSASSTTACGTARFPLCSAPLAPFLFPASPFALPPSAPPFASPSDLRSSVSCRTSSMTRRSSAGKEEASPERRRERAWFSMFVGQLAESALRECRRRSWILEARGVH